MAYNIMVMRKDGVSLSRIRDNIRRNIEGNNRNWRDQRSPSRLLQTQQRRDALAAVLREALRSDDECDAISGLNEYDDVRGSYSDWVDWLDEHFSGQFFKCYDCDVLGTDDDSYNVRDDYSVCSHCVSNYFYSERNSYYDDSADDDDDDDREDEHIGSYHSSRHHLGHIASAYDQRRPRVLLGLELEMEINNEYSRNEKAGELLEAIGERDDGQQYALIEGDGSLNRGFELVTAYTGLDVHAAQLAFFKGGFRGAKSHNTSTCGLHVHVCKSDMTMLHAAKMILFINDTNNQALVKAIARRDASGYAKLQDKSADKSWLRDALRCGDTKARQLRNINSDRYEALNFQNDKTIEFRLFKGTLKYQTIMACLEFAFITWFFARDTSQQQLNTENFLQYICLENNRRDTPHLRAYLLDKGFKVPYTHKARPAQFGGVSTTTIEEI